MKATIALACSIGSLALMQASTLVSFTGNFNDDDNEQIFTLVTAQPTTLTALTWSYAGGVNATGMDIPEGGFDPVLSLFMASNGLLLAEDNNGGCGLVAEDSVTHQCWDAYLAEPLAAGSYTLVLTENDNLPYGPYLASGFSKTGQGDFTGSEFTGHAGAFYDETGDERTSLWAVDLGGVVVTPEPRFPGLALAVGLGLWLCARGFRRRRAAAVGLAVLAVLAFAAAPAQAVEARLSADAFVSQANRGVNFGGLPNLMVDQSDIVLLQFDLSGVPANINSNQVAKAMLTVYVNAMSLSNVVNVGQVGGTWTESGVTYNTLPGLQGTLGELQINAAGQYYSVDVTKAVMEWMHNPEMNYGLFLQGQNPNSVFLDAKESVGTSHPATLDITLAGPAGAQGPAGPQGPTGPTGPTGPQGPAGSALVVSAWSADLSCGPLKYCNQSWQVPALATIVGGSCYGDSQWLYLSSSYSTGLEWYCLYWNSDPFFSHNISAQTVYFLPNNGANAAERPVSRGGTLPTGTKMPHP
ncbi:MAG: DVUA0089 family protein [Bryobacteraceae bacterium]|jgi:hypothetical protein